MSNIYVNNSNHSLTTSFYSKVMGYFALALFTSALGIWVMLAYFPQYILSQTVVYGLMAVELLLVFTARYWSTKEPINRVLFFLFAFMSGLTAAPLIALALAEIGPAILMKALVVTGTTFAAMALVGSRSEKDFSFLQGFLFIGLIGMIVLSLIHFVWPWSNTFELYFSGFGILLFSGFTLHDIQKIKLMPQANYIDAALMLYLDIFNLFISVLRFFLASSRD